MAIVLESLHQGPAERDDDDVWDEKRPSADFVAETKWLRLGHRARPFHLEGPALDEVGLPDSWLALLVELGRCRSHPRCSRCHRRPKKEVVCVRRPFEECDGCCSL